jgi:2-methylcitrate dehydratase PrpD
MHETQTLARFVAESQWSEIPLAMCHEAKRALLNWMGCALAGCRDDTVERTLAALNEFSGQRTASLIGRREKVDALHAALVNGIASNILDYDDTHLRTVMHPSVPVAATLCALAEHRSVTGAQFIHAFVLGIEVGCRIGNAVSPWHYEHGWHISSTCGVFGAAAAAARALGLNTQQTAWALGIAATQASGLREMMGGMGKSYNLGHAARSGLLAVLLAERSFTSSARSLEAPAGFAQVLGNNPALGELTRGLGETWELAGNAYKPYPCGIVLHAAIDACLELRAETALVASEVASVAVRMNPLALEITGRETPASGLEGKLSVAHAVAAALVHGTAGVAQFTDACVREPAIVALRRTVTTQADAACDTAEAHVAITLKDGRRLTRHIMHATGSLQQPMTDAQIETKFHELAAYSHSGCDARKVIEIAWSLERIDDAAEFVRAAVPHAATTTDVRA